MQPVEELGCHTHGNDKSERMWSLRGWCGLLTLAAAPAWPMRTPHSARRTDLVVVRIDASEAEATLAVLRKRRGGGSPSIEDWSRLFATAGYRALKRRETAMGRAFADEGFREFVLSDSLLARTPELERTAAAWEHLDVAQAAQRALAYLPPDTRLRATIFLEIKPVGNSFVFDLDGTRAIFLYVDPGKTAAQVENVVAHELHHSGVAAACQSVDDTTSPARVRQAREWMTAFGEGLAMLAAAGGPEVHPHALDDETTRARWDRDVARFNPDLDRLQRFFLAILDGKISADSAQRAGMSFFGIQGPWYTVGWKMAVTVERTFGRRRLVATVCHPVGLLSAYNDAIASRGNPERLATWSSELLRRVGHPAPDSRARRN